MFLRIVAGITMRPLSFILDVTLYPDVTVSELAAIVDIYIDYDILLIVVKYSLCDIFLRLSTDSETPHPAFATNPTFREE